MTNDQSGARGSLVRGAVLGCAIVTAAGFVTHTALPVGMLYPLKAAAAFAVIVGIALYFIHEHPFPNLGPGNYITIVRAMLVALSAALIGELHTSSTAAAAVAAATLSAVLDGIDGLLARRSGMASVFGGRFDVETDAALIMVLSVLVWQHERAGAWVLASGLMRYAFVASGWVLPWMAGPLTPTLRGRIAAVVQVAGLSLALLPGVSPPASTLVAATSVAVLTWSFALDVGRLWRAR